MLQIRKAWVSHGERKAAFRREGSQDLEGEPTEVQDRTALARGTIGMGVWKKLGALSDMPSILLWLMAVIFWDVFPEEKQKQDPSLNPLNPSV